MSRSLKTTLNSYLKNFRNKFNHNEQLIIKPEILPDDILLRVTNLWHEAQHEASKNNQVNAIELLYKALELQPDNPEILYQLGVTERKLGFYEEAYDNLLLSIHNNPKYVPAYHELFLICCKLEKFEDAEEFISKAIEIEPNNARLYCDLGNMNIEQKQYEKAISLYNQSIDLMPDWGIAYNNLANCYLRMMKYYEAEQYLLIAQALKTNTVELYINLHYLYFSLGKFSKAYRYAKKGLSIYPANEQLNWMYCWLLLMHKRFSSGWAKYDVRFSEIGGVTKRELPFPPWQGEPLINKTIVIIAEQGLGDQLMFASCLPDLLTQTVSCIVECDLKLKHLFERSFPTIKFLGTQRQSDTNFIAALPDHIDYHAHLGDLPRWFRNDPANFFPAKPYIMADSESMTNWQRHLNELGRGLKVGISWRGGVEKTRTIFRTIPLSEWLPIFRVPGVHFINLQYGDCEHELIEARNHHGIDIHHWDQAIIDYDQTAALVSSLDLVISVCTSIVHLTGSLGKLAWVMVPCSPEWRYLAHDKTMPWYQNVKLYRQQQAGDWKTVITALSKELTALSNSQKNV